ncbi:MAG: acetoacetate decarboxylase family protein [Candidatus Thorarchaeota archaeon]|nr:acetoacetate decarboxylase family protein [Candidatus Thorarchaeota archaeon]
MDERYSTPLPSPLYPKPPYHYKDAKLFLALFYPPEGTLEKLLPAPMRPSQLPLAGVMIGEMPCVETGKFMEAAVLAQCMFDDPDTGEEVGVHFSHNYVDTDVALASGREFWGYPRKIAQISLEMKGDTITGKVERDGQTLLKTTCELVDEGEWIDSGPNINTKVIPSVTGSGYDLAVLTAAHLNYDTRNGRSGEVEIEIANGPRDDFSLVKIETTMIGLYFDCDITVPLGKVVGKLDI